MTSEIYEIHLDLYLLRIYCEEELKRTYVYEKRTNYNDRLLRIENATINVDKHISM